MPVAYNSRQITAAPMFSLSKSYQTTGDGYRVGSLWNIVIEGKFLPYKGSPNASGFFEAAFPSLAGGVWTYSGTVLPDDELAARDYMDAILRKQEAIRDLFAVEGKLLYVDGWNGAEPIYCYPRIKAPIEFPRGSPTSWASIADYRVTLEADAIYRGSGVYEDTGDISNYHIENFDESWNIEPADYDLNKYRLTHQLSAKGKRFYDNNGTLLASGWQNAKTYVLTKLGLDTYDTLPQLYATGILNDSNLEAFDYARSQQVNEANGTFACTETFMCFPTISGVPATDSFEVNSVVDQAGVAKVSVKGKIEGAEKRNTTTRALTSTKYTNAVLKWNTIRNTLLARASGLSNITLNPTELTKTVGYNNINGVITYDYEYDNRQLATISGALSENVNIAFEYPTDVFAELCILGRAAGPLLQGIQTVTSSKKHITLEAVLPARTMTSSATKPDTNSYISGLAPTATSVFKHGDRENWSEKDGRYSRSVSWTYTN